MRIYPLLEILVGAAIIAGLMFLAARYAERLGEVLSTFKVWE